MSGFDFISKMLSASWKPGAALALVAGVVRVLRDHGVSPFASLDGPLYQYLMVAGLIGAAITLVELACFGGTIIGMFLTNFVDTVVEKRDKKQLSIRNYDSLSADYADVLLYLRHNNMKRFMAENSNSVLYHMYRAHLLESDDPTAGPFAIRVYYKVPDHIWNRIDNDVRLGARAIPKDPPWIRAANPHGWMR